MANRIQFRFDSIRFQKDFSVCIGFREIWLLSKHHGGSNLRARLKLLPPRTTQHYRIEGLKRAPQFGPHYTKRRFCLGFFRDSQSMFFFSLAPKKNTFSLCYSRNIIKDTTIVCVHYCLRASTP